MTTKTTEHNCGICGESTSKQDHFAGVYYCDTCCNREDWSYGELMDFTHEQSVAIFNWCGCEDNEGNENPYADCPKGEI